MMTFIIHAYNNGHLVDDFTVEAVGYKDAHIEGKRKMLRAYPHILRPSLIVTLKEEAK